MEISPSDRMPSNREEVRSETTAGIVRTIWTDGGSEPHNCEVIGENPDLIPSNMSVSIPPDATDDETAAIVAAIGAHLADLDRTTSTEPAGDRWTGRRWAFIGRIEQRQVARSVPRGAPTNPWTATGRADRF